MYFIVTSVLEYIGSINYYQRARVKVVSKSVNFYDCKHNFICNFIHVHHLNNKAHSFTLNLRVSTCGSYFSNFLNISSVPRHNSISNDRGIGCERASRFTFRAVLFVRSEFYTQ